MRGRTFISLSDTEQRCYSGLYALCQPDSSGKPAAGKVAELFRASQLPAETLHQVTEVCGAKRLGYFGCGQFYVALKLMAAAQAGLPVRLESISGGKSSAFREQRENQRGSGIWPSVLGFTLKRDDAQRPCCAERAPHAELKLAQTEPV
uniref:EH domain-containing protein n=1 Tax=Sinocyclocheilus rhinocerous TaxID=307959 RepID=A0A673GRL5_9TELE